MQGEVIVLKLCWGNGAVEVCICCAVGVRAVWDDMIAYDMMLCCWE